MQKSQITTLLVLASFSLFTACSSEKTKEQQPQPQVLNVKTITVQNKKVPIWVQFTGRTRASSHQDVKARVSGILEKVFFKDGAYVHKGELLFLIEQKQYKAQLDMAKAKKMQHQAALQLAKADVSRYKPLVKEGLAPRAKLEEYEAQLASLKAAIQEDNARIAEASIKLGYTSIKAPVDGYASARRVDVGNLVGQQEATLLTTIVKTDPLYVYFSPSLKDANMMYHYGEKKKTEVFVESKDINGSLRLHGELDFANNSVDPMTSTITMRATIQNKNHTLLPGTFVYVNVFVSDKYKFIMIPPHVIFEDQLGKYVYIVDKENRLKRADIQTGYGTRFYISVKKGLHDGDRVVVSGLVKLKPGIKVVAKDVTQTEGIDALLKKNHLLPNQEQKR